MFTADLERNLGPVNKLPVMPATKLGQAIGDRVNVDLLRVVVVVAVVGFLGLLAVTKT